MHPDMANIDRRVRELRRRLGMNQEAFGRLFGVDQSTVSRWESGRQIPEGATLIRMAEMAQQSPREFLGEVEIKAASTINVSVIGQVQAGNWVEATEWPENKQYLVSVLFKTEYKNARRFALETRGPSMNLVFPEGTILDCVSIYDVRQPIEAAKEPPIYVIVERRRADGLREATCKEYVVDKDGRVWLWPRSDDPEHQQPLHYLPDSDQKNGVDSVEITALVVGYYRNI
jgi:transcriptional regulator with XRE-family HTH domain